MRWTNISAFEFQVRNKQSGPQRLIHCRVITNQTSFATCTNAGFHRWRLPSPLKTWLSWGPKSPSNTSRVLSVTKKIFRLLRVRSRPWSQRMCMVNSLHFSKRPLPSKHLRDLESGCLTHDYRARKWRSRDALATIKERRPIKFRNEWRTGTFWNGILMGLCWGAFTDHFMDHSRSKCSFCISWVCQDLMSVLLHELYTL